MIALQLTDRHTQWADLLPERQTDIQTEYSETETHRKWHINRQTDRQRVKGTFISRKTGRHIKKLTYSQPDRPRQMNALED